MKNTSNALRRVMSVVLVFAMTVSYTHLDVYKRQLQTQWSEFLSRGNIIDNSADAYNEQARAAQKKLSGFPASLIAGLTGVQAEEFSA